LLLIRQTFKAYQSKYFSVQMDKEMDKPKVEIFTGTPTKQEIINYWSKIKIDQPSLQSTPKDQTQFFNDSFSSSEDELSDSFKLFLKEASEDAAAKKAKSKSTANASIYIGTPTAKEVRQYFKRDLVLTDLTVTNTSSEIDSTFEEFIKAKRQQVIQTQGEEYNNKSDDKKIESENKWSNG
jgi:hypothetical protein